MLLRAIERDVAELDTVDLILTETDVESVDLNFTERRGPERATGCATACASEMTRTIDWPCAASLSSADASEGFVLEGFVLEEGIVDGINPGIGPDDPVLALWSELSSTHGSSCPW